MGAGAGADELLSALMVAEGESRRLDQVVVAAVAALERRGTFAERGYRSAAGALGDLLGWERFEARRRRSTNCAWCGIGAGAASSIKLARRE